ncbi:MAG: Rne/Rng family ribonuclease [Bacteroidales bacterium]|nr:Rne/Rng family ribonuclease [Bacteroidales bacterium]
MNRELIIDSRASEVDIVLLEDKLLVELHKEKTNNNYAVGDIYLGKVRKIMPGLNAAFVDVGYEKDAFLHYLDLGPQIRSLNKYVKLSISGKPENITMDNFRPEPDIEKTGKITQVLASGAQILVQIAKEPISTKGPRISSEISFAGRYLVLVPFSSRISVSQKIRSSEERNRLKRLIQSIKPNNYGVIIRTVAENKKVAELDADLRSLIEKWEKTTEKLQHAKPPAKIMSELDRTSAILRDLLNESFNSVHVNDPNLYEEIKSFIHTIAPQKTDIVKLYKGRTPIFDFFGVDKQIKSLFGKTVSIRSGVYLIIEHTEAMHVIDVNSGHRVNKENSQEENALEVNLEAAAEIARQLRLRDMGGIIVIDFIDMHDSKHRRELYQKLKEEMARDHAKHTILPPSKFGLVQITRQRVRPEMNVEILESCPVCEGTGKIKPSILFVDEIENNLKYLIQDQNEKQITLAVHPFIFAYLTKGPISVRTRWMWKYKKVFTIKAMKNYHMLDYRFFNQNNDELAI